MTLPPQQKPDVLNMWKNIGAKFAELLATRAHADLIITVAAGEVKLVRVNQSFLPADVVGPPK